MGDDLAQLLYDAFRAAAVDFTVHPSWGNLESHDRETWEAVATKARRELGQRLARDMSYAAEELGAEQAIANLRERWMR